MSGARRKDVLGAGSNGLLLREIGHKLTDFGVLPPFVSLPLLLSLWAPGGIADLQAELEAATSDGFSALAAELLVQFAAVEAGKFQPLVGQFQELEQRLEAASICQCLFLTLLACSGWTYWHMKESERTVDWGVARRVVQKVSVEDARWIERMMGSLEAFL